MLPNGKSEAYKLAKRPKVHCYVVTNNAITIFFKPVCYLANIALVFFGALVFCIMERELIKIEIFFFFL